MHGINWWAFREAEEEASSFQRSALILFADTFWGKQQDNRLYEPCPVKCEYTNDRQRAGQGDDNVNATAIWSSQCL